MIGQRAVFEEEFDDVAVALPTGRVQCRPVLQVDSVDLGAAAGQEEGDHFRVALPGRNMQRRPPLKQRVRQQIRRFGAGSYL